MCNTLRLEATKGTPTPSFAHPDWVLELPSRRFPGPPRPRHQVRLFFSSPLVRSKVHFSPSEALSRAISVSKIVDFHHKVFCLSNRNPCAKASMRNALPGIRFYRNLRVKKPGSSHGSPPFRQKHRYPKIFCTPNFCWFHRAVKPRKSGQKTWGTTRKPRFFPHKSVPKEICTPSFFWLFAR